MSSLYDTDPVVQKGVDFALEVFASCFDKPANDTPTTSENPILANDSFVTVSNTPKFDPNEKLSSELDAGIDPADFGNIRPTTHIPKHVQISDFEKTPSQAKRERQAERKKTLGKNWFDFKPSEMTEELKRDLKIIKSRNLIGNGAFSNVTDFKKKLPSAVQIGTVVEPKSEYYSARIPKKMRQKTLVDELAADFDFRKKLKAKFQKIQDSKPRRLKSKKLKSKRK